MAKLFPRVRFLPMTIFVAALMLTVRMGSIWEGFENVLTDTISVAAVRAQQAPRETTAPQPLQPPVPAQNGETAEGTETKKPGEGDQAEVSRLVSDDPTLLTLAEIDLLQQLAERRELLDARENEMEQRSGLLEAAESRIDKKVIELKALQENIEQLVKTHALQRDAKLESLVKIYENMKPKDAARIFEELDMNTLLRVAERMKERKLAPVMAQMNSERAKEMTVQLTRSGQLPLPGSADGG